MRRWTLALLAATAGASGCGTQQALLGGQKDYLFSAFDVVTVPDRPVDLAARLQGGDLLVSRTGYVVRFSRDGALYRAAETNGEGVAAVTFVPPEPGDYLFLSELSPNGFAESPPPPAPLHVVCRKPDTPLLITDMDKTTVASGFERVLVGDAEPMPGAADLLGRLSKDYTIVYLTHRPGYFGPRSKVWLARHGFPPGAVLLSSVGGFLSGSGAFKTAELARLKTMFSRMGIGVGDKVSDARAYVDNGMKAFLIIRPGAISSADGLRELAADLATLPEDVQVVTGWDQIGKILFEKADYPRPAAQVMLLEKAEKMGATKPAEGRSEPKEWRP